MKTFPILKRLEGRSHPVPIKEHIEQATYRLKIQLDKLEHMYSRLRERDTELFQRCVGAQLSRDVAHARIFANECSEIRKIAKIVLASQLALEKVLLRLQTVEEFGDIMVQVAPVIGIVQETKSNVAGLVPEVAKELEQVNNTLSDLTMEAGEVTSTPSSVSNDTTDEEAKRILTEAGSLADEKLRDHFPEIPSMESPPTAQEETVELTSAQPTAIPDPNRDDKVYEYVKNRDGEIMVSSCAKDLGMTPDEVESALNRLRQAGKVLIE